MFGNKVFRLKRDESTGGWRKLYNEGIHNLHPSPNMALGIK
jgi:hypothetical protein